MEHEGIMVDWGSLSPEQRKQFIALIGEPQGRTPEKRGLPTWLVVVNGAVKWAYRLFLLWIILDIWLNVVRK